MCLLFSKSTKEVFSVYRVWHSPNTLPTMIHGQAFLYYDLTTPHLDSSPYEQLFGFEPWEPLPPKCLLRAIQEHNLSTVQDD